jgi:uncharacterized protein YfaQ (DUF2300 family)
MDGPLRTIRVKGSGMSEPELAATDVVHRMASRHRLSTSLAALLAIFAIAYLLQAVWSSGPTAADRARLTQVATATLVSSQAPTATVTDVSIEALDRVVDSGRQAWRVTISGDVTEAGRTSPSYRSHEIIYVYDDDDDGEVRIFAQG